MSASAPTGAAPYVLEPGGPAPALREYLGVLLRRKLLVILPLLIVPTAVVALSLRQQPLYRGTAQVLLGHLDLATGLTGIPDASLREPERVAETQAGLARLPMVAIRALRATGLRDRTARDFLKASSVATEGASDLLRFTVTDPDPKLASRLASAYAHAYSSYRLELDTTAIRQARRDLETRINALKARNGGQGSLYESLVTNDEKLRTMEALLSANAAVVQTGEDAIKIRPQPQRTAILATAFALVLGVGLAFLAEAVDTRIRAVDEIGQRLGLPLLARLPEWKRRRRHGLLVSQDPLAPTPSPGLVVLDDPDSDEAEAYRVLRANLDLVNAEERARCIMVTSALESEGKSETVANLAVALARTGRRVALVDLDLRRPTLHQLFDVSGRHSVADVAAGTAGLEEALLRVPLPRSVDDFPRLGGTNGRPGQDVLELLPAHRALPASGEFGGTQMLGEILRDLRERVDLVLLDTPALLRVGDGIALSAHVDALLVVVRFKTIRRPILKELRRVLDACPAPKLGYVITDAENGLGYGYGYGLKSRRQPNDAELERPLARALVPAEQDRVPEWT